MGDGILPEEVGWVRRLSQFLKDRIEASAVGLPILAADDTIAHAGGELATDEFGHARLKLHGHGLPRGMIRGVTRSSGLLPDGCLAFRRSDVPLLTADLGRFHTAEGAMTALSIRAAAHGGAWTLTPPAMVRVAARGERSPIESLLRQADLDLANTWGRETMWSPSSRMPVAQPTPLTLNERRHAA